jgi:lipid II:glycine glycyltransferase (peptidoglycan interpeptide bridge formation enzyme)
MFASKTSDRIIGSVAVYAFDDRRAYYLFGASDPELRDSPTGTAVLWDAFGALAAAGISQIDLEGVNSPRRGWFKMSFGGELRHYYQITKASG